MEEIKDNGKMHTITFDGYKAGCFPESKNVKEALLLADKNNLDLVILGTSSTDGNGFTLHFVTNKGVNVKRLVEILVEQGKKNNLYWKHKGIQSQKSARVHSANLKLIQ